MYVEESVCRGRRGVCGRWEECLGGGRCVWEGRGEGGRNMRMSVAREENFIF